MNTQINTQMNTQQQAFVNGFVKRASEYGFDRAKALELFKQAAPPAPIAAINTTSSSDPQQSHGILERAKSWIKNKLPGYPTSVGSTAQGVDALANQFKELGGG